MPKRTKKSSESHDEVQEMRRQNLTRFIQQFEKEAQERMQDLEDKMENMLTTVDKLFRVELMKMPPSLKDARVGDVLGAEETPSSDVSIALRNETIEVQPLQKGASKRLKTADSRPVQATPTLKGKPVKGERILRTRTRTLSDNISSGNLGKAFSSLKRADSLKTPIARKPNLRSVVSAGDLNPTTAAAQLTVTTGEGLTVSLSADAKDDKWDLLDDVAWRQVSTFLDRLSSRCQKMSD